MNQVIQITDCIEKKTTRTSHCTDDTSAAIQAAIAARFGKGATFEEDPEMRQGLNRFGQAMEPVKGAPVETTIATWVCIAVS